MTLYINALPDDSLDYIGDFSDLSNRLSLDDVAGELQAGLEKQTSMPIIELGALVFYSGLIILDLILNFTFAIPQMLTLLVNGVTGIFGIDSYIALQFQLFLSIVVIGFYFIGAVQLLTNIRAGSAIAG